MTTLSSSSSLSIILSTTIADGDGEMSWSNQLSVLSDGSIVVDGDHLYPTFPVVGPTSREEAEAIVDLYCYDSNSYYSPEYGDAPWME